MAADRFEIARRIASDVGSGGIYRTEMRAVPRQGLVDLWWSAFLAGRILGVPVDVRTSKPITCGKNGPVVLVEVHARASVAASA